MHKCKCECICKGNEAGYRATVGDNEAGSVSEEKQDVPDPRSWRTERDEDVVHVCGGQYLPVCCCVLGSRHQQTVLELDCLMAMSERRMLSKLHVIGDSLLLHDGSDTGLCSVSFHQDAPQNTSGSHSCLGPLNFTTPSSVSHNLSQ